MAFLCFRLDRLQLLDHLRTAIDTVRELQLIIDCDNIADEHDELASTLMFFAELELTNALHVVDLTGTPQLPAPPSQPMTVCAF